MSVSPEEFSFSDITIKYEVREYSGFGPEGDVKAPRAAYVRLLLNLPHGRILTVTVEGYAKFSRVRKAMRYLGLDQSKRESPPYY